MGRFYCQSIHVTSNTASCTSKSNNDQPDGDEQQTLEGTTSGPLNDFLFWDPTPVVVIVIEPARFLAVRDSPL